MKMMDNVAGIVAFRHARCNIVTASIGKTHYSCFCTCYKFQTLNCILSCRVPLPNRQTITIYMC